VLRNNLWVGQIGLFSRAQLAAMRDTTKRRNYSAEAERFRREHERHREWGLAQRHARKLSRLYGSTANAAEVFQRRADELRSPSAPARAAASTSCESVGPEPVGPESVASAPAPPEPAGPKAIGSEPVKPEPVKPEPVKPEPVELEPVELEPVELGPVELGPVELEQVVPEAVEPECVEDAASAGDPSDPSESGNAGRCPDRRFCSGRPGKRRPERPGRHFGTARKGIRRPELARRIRARTGTESPENQVRRRVGGTGVKDACRRRRTPLSARRGRMASSLPKYCREHMPP